MYFIKDIMTTPVISIDFEANAETAAKLMSENNISSLLVKEGEEHVGIITKTDLVKRLIAKGLDPKSTSVHMVMSSPLLVREQNIGLNEANEFMLRKKIKHLVVTLNAKVRGILTTKDLLAKGGGE